MKLPVTRIQRFSTHDGAGVRTVVFLKGCPLRCAWCHNPETQRLQPEVLYFAGKCIGCGACAQVCPHGAHLLQETSHVFDRTKCAACMACAEACPAAALEPAAQNMDLDEIVRAVLRDRAFYGETGGVTLSGGEPMVHGPLTLELLRRCKAAGLTTAVETCGHFDPELLPTLAQVTDEFLWDVKDTNPDRHKAYTGVDSSLILRNLRSANALGARLILRCILVRGVNLNDAHAQSVRALYRSLSHAERIDLLPYHPYGSSKSAQLGRVHDGHPEWIPTEEEMARFRAVLGASF